jgi:hypothetical protein
MAFIIYYYWWGGTKSLGTAATSGLLYITQMIDKDDCGAIGGMKIGRGNRSTRRKPAPAPLCPPQIPHDQTRTWARAAAVGSQRLTAWAMAWPLFMTLLVVTTITFTMRSSLPCWLFILVGPLIAGFLVAVLIWFLCSPPDVVSLIGSFWSAFLSSFYLLFWSRLSALVQSGLLSSTVGWTRKHLLKGFHFPCQLVLLRISTIRSLFVVEGQRYLCRRLGILSRWLAILTSVLVM